MRGRFRTLSPKRSAGATAQAGGGLWAFLNSGFGLWVLSSVAIGSLTFVYNVTRAHFDTVGRQRTAHEQILLELDGRVAECQRLLITQAVQRKHDYMVAANAYDAKYPGYMEYNWDTMLMKLQHPSYNEQQLATAATDAKRNPHVEVRVDTGRDVVNALEDAGIAAAPGRSIVFPEYRERSLRALLWELDHISDDDRTLTEQRLLLLNQIENIVRNHRSQTRNYWDVEKRTRRRLWRTVTLMASVSIRYPSVLPLRSEVAIPANEEDERGLLNVAEALNRLHGVEHQLAQQHRAMNPELP